MKWQATIPITLWALLLTWTNAAIAGKAITFAKQEPVVVPGSRA